MTPLPEKSQSPTMANTQSSCGDAETFSKLVVQLSAYLQRLSPICRREVISKWLTGKQRAVLCSHMLEKQTSRALERDSRLTSGDMIAVDDCSEAGSVPSSHCREREESGQHYDGVCVFQTYGVHRGYYARACVRALGFRARVRRSRDEAISDHEFLIEVIKKTQSGDSTVAFSQKVRQAVADVLAESGVSNPITSVQVYFHSQHFIGSRQLILSRRTLEEGLHMWEEMRAARGPNLFKGGGVTSAYTPEAAEKQWQRVRQTYVRFVVQSGCCHDEVEKRLKKLEAEHLPERQRKDQQLARHRATAKPELADRNSDAWLLRALARLLRRQLKDRSRHARLAEREAAGERRKKERRVRKLLKWDRHETEIDRAKRLRVQFVAS